MADLIETIITEAQKWGRWKWIVLGFITISVIIFAIFSQLTDSQKEGLLGKHILTRTTSFPGIEIEEKILEVDLTEWTEGYGPEDGKAVFRTTYKGRKIRGDVDYFWPPNSDIRKKTTSFF